VAVIEGLGLIPRRIGTYAYVLHPVRKLRHRLLEKLQGVRLRRGVTLAELVMNHRARLRPERQHGKPAPFPYPTIRDEIQYFCETFIFCHNTSHNHILRFNPIQIAEWLQRLLDTDRFVMRPCLL